MKDRSSPYLDPEELVVTTQKHNDNNDSIDILSNNYRFLLYVGCFMISRYPTHSTVHTRGEATKGNDKRYFSEKNKDPVLWIFYIT
jgi:hypothetical protein